VFIAFEKHLNSRSSLQFTWVWIGLAQLFEVG
jgi:hypothetical protein